MFLFKLIFVHACVSVFKTAEVKMDECIETQCYCLNGWLNLCECKDTEYMAVSKWAVIFKMENIDSNLTYWTHMILVGLYDFMINSYTLLFNKSSMQETTHCFKNVKYSVKSSCKY